MCFLLPSTAARSPNSAKILRPKLQVIKGTAGRQAGERKSRESGGIGKVFFFRAQARVKTKLSSTYSTHTHTGSGSESRRRRGEYEEEEEELTYIVKFASFDSLTVSDRRRCIIYCAAAAANNARFDFPRRRRRRHPSCRATTNNVALYGKWPLSLSLYVLSSLARWSLPICP